MLICVESKYCDAYCLSPGLLARLHQCADWPEASALSPCSPSWTHREVLCILPVMQHFKGLNGRLNCEGTWTVTTLSIALVLIFGQASNKRTMLVWPFCEAEIRAVLPSCQGCVGKRRDCMKKLCVNQLTQCITMHGLLHRPVSWHPRQRIPAKMSLFPHDRKKMPTWASFFRAAEKGEDNKRQI